MNKIAENVILLLFKHYVYPEKIKYVKIVVDNHIASGRYNRMHTKKFITTLNKDIFEVLQDQHVMLSIKKKPPKKKVTPCFRQLTVFPHNIGYFRFDCFKSLKMSMGYFISAFKLLENVNAIIFDLRYNGGGYPTTVDFIQSFLFEKRTLLNITSARKRNATTLTRHYTLSKKQMDNIIYNYRHQGKISLRKHNIARTLKYKRFYNIPVVVLIGKKTFSAAEEFAYNLQNKKRAIIIGETSGGGANGGKDFSVKGKIKNLRIFISRANSYNPITKTSWEGNGIKPDIRVKNSAKSIDRALDFLQKKYKFK